MEEIRKNVPKKSNFQQIGHKITGTPPLKWKTYEKSVP